MQPRSAGIQKAIQNLLDSSMAGELRRGDTLGVWTFNQALYAGKFPLQKWAPEAKADIGIKVSAFLRGQTYEKKADFDQVLPALEKLIKGSDFITVILVTAGDDKIKGTPFDDPINGYYKLWRDQQRKAQMPFLTILRATRGEITHYAMGAGDWNVEMPPLAPEIKAAADAEKNAPVAPPKAQTSSVPPLVVYGKNSRLAQSSAPKTNALPVEGSGDSNVVPRIASTASTNSIPAPVGQLAPSNQPVAQSPVTSNSFPGRDASTPTNLTRTAGQKPAEVQPMTSAVPEKPPLVIAKSANAPSNAAPTGLATPSTPVATPPGETVATASSDGIATWKIVLAVGFVLIVVVAGVAVLLLRRSRAVAPVSLITRSLDRGKNSKQ